MTFVRDDRFSTEVLPEVNAVTKYIADVGRQDGIKGGKVRPATASEGNKSVRKAVEGLESRES